jgi:hypothetical protein
MDPHEAFAELGRIRLADIDNLLDKISQLVKRAIPGASEVSVTPLPGNTPRTAAYTGALAWPSTKNSTNVTPMRS